MSILNFQKPDKIIMQKATDFEGTFEFRPLELGFGQTIGNSLRRILLSSLEGFAISAVRIAGVDHEFATRLRKRTKRLYPRPANNTRPRITTMRIGVIWLTPRTLRRRTRPVAGTGR